MASQISQFRELVAAGEARLQSEITKRRAVEKRLAALVATIAESTSGDTSSQAAVLAADLVQRATTCDMDDEEIVAILAALLIVDAAPHDEQSAEPLVDADDIRELATLFETELGRRRFVLQLQDVLPRASVIMTSASFELIVELLQSFLASMFSSGDLDVIGGGVLCVDRRLIILIVSLSLLLLFFRCSARRYASCIIVENGE
jgi:hypothetical protein